MGRQRCIMNGTEKVKDHYGYMLGVINVVQGMANTVVGRAIFDARDALKKTPLWRHGVKKTVNQAYREYEKYEWLHTQDFGDRYVVFLQYLDGVEDQIQPHVDILKMTVWQQFTRMGLNYGEQRARLMTARILAGLSTACYRLSMKRAYEDTGYDYNPHFFKANLEHIEKMLATVCETVCMTRDPEMDHLLANDPQITTAIDIITKKYSAHDTVNDVMAEVIRRNPVMLKYCNAESLKYLEEHYGIRKEE